VVVKDLKEADILVTQRRYYRDRLQPIVEAENGAFLSLWSSRIRLVRSNNFWQTRSQGS